MTIPFRLGIMYSKERMTNIHQSNSEKNPEYRVVLRKANASRRPRHPTSSSRDLMYRLIMTSELALPKIQPYTEYTAFVLASSKGTVL